MERSQALSGTVEGLIRFPGSYQRPSMPGAKNCKIARMIFTGAILLRLNSRDGSTACRNNCRIAAVRGGRPPLGRRPAAHLAGIHQPVGIGPPLEREPMIGIRGLLPPVFEDISVRGGGADPRLLVVGDDLV